MNKLFYSIVLCMVGTTVQAAENASGNALVKSEPTEETVLVTFKDGQAYYPKAVIEQLPLYKLFVEDLGQDSVVTFPLEATSITQKHFEHIAWSKVYFRNKIPYKAIAYIKDFYTYSDVDLISLFETARKLLENSKPVYSDPAKGEFSETDEITCRIGSYLYREIFAKNPQKTFALMTREQFDEMNKIWVDGLGVGYFESEKIFALTADNTVTEEPIPDLSPEFIQPYVLYVQRFLYSNETAAKIKMRTGAPVYQREYFDTLYKPIKESKQSKTTAILLRWIATVYGADMIKQKEGCLDNVFAQAVETKNSRLVAALIAAGFDVDQQLACGYGFRALLSAAYNGDLEIVDLLLKAKAQVDLVDDTNNTPLMMAVYSDHKPENREKIVQLLLAAQANPKLKNSVQDTALSRASYFGYTNVVQALIAAGAELDSPNMYGSTPLIAASSQGHVAVVAALLDAGAHKDLADNLERKAIDHARMGKHDAIVALLQAGEDAGKSESLGIGQPIKKNTWCLML